MSSQHLFRIPVNLESETIVSGEPEYVLTAANPYSFFFWDISPDGNIFTVVATRVTFEKTRQPDAVVEWWRNWAQSLTDE